MQATRLPLQQTKRAALGMPRPVPWRRRDGRSKAKKKRLAQHR